MTADPVATPEQTARRMKGLIDPIHMVAYMSEEPDRELVALGLRDNYWDGYFAGRGGPLGRVPAEVVDAVFYNFAPGEVARHIPRVWRVTTPEAAVEARTRGCGAALRRVLGDVVGDDAVVRTADLALQAAVAAPLVARPLFAGYRAQPVPTEPMQRLWHAATLLREYRGDCHNVALAAHGVGRSECHVLAALDGGMLAHQFGRLSHLPRPQIDAVVDGLRARGLVDADGWFTDEGRALRERIETMTDELDAPAYASLTAAELAELITGLEPIAAALDADQAEAMAELNSTD